jgi:hypothetical protein
LFRAGLSGFPDDVFLVRRNVFRDCRRMTFDVVKHKRIRRDHRAQRMSLAAIRINPNFHKVPLRAVVVPLEVSARVDAKLHTCPNRLSSQVFRPPLTPSIWPVM